MKLWVAKDMYATMMFWEKPVLHNVDGKKSWEGNRANYFEPLLDVELKNEIKVNAKPIQIEIKIEKIEE